jgi:hypothetical protein
VLYGKVLSSRVAGVQSSMRQYKSQYLLDPKLGVDGGGNGAFLSFQVDRPGILQERIQGTPSQLSMPSGKSEESTERGC